MTASNAPSTITFIDTNIWAYAFNKSQDPAKTRLAKENIRRETSIVVSTQVMNELSYTLIRKAKATERDIQRLINSFYRKYIVIEFAKSILLRASILRDHYHFSYWDSLIAASALSANASKLLSEDMQHGMVIEGQLTIINPFLPQP
jgi:predicted nucleic acid-binding protein